MDTDLEGKFELKGQVTPVAVKDVSESGALIQFRRPVEIGVGEMGQLTFRLGVEGDEIDVGFRIMRGAVELDTYGGAYEGLSLELKQKIKASINQWMNKELSSGGK